MARSLRRSSQTPSSRHRRQRNSCGLRWSPGPSIATHDDPRAGHGNPVPLDKDWGDPDGALRRAPVVIEAKYETPREYNVPIEPHGLIAHWEADDRLTIYEPSQWIDGMANHYATWFGLAFDNVRVVSPFVGGGFGSKGQALPHSAAAAIAARMLRRPVKLAVSRPQTFTAYGGRPATRQTLKLGATRTASFSPSTMTGRTKPPRMPAFIETLGIVTSHDVCRSEFPLAPTDRAGEHRDTGCLCAPGKNPSAFALECAMDGLAIELGLDPVEFACAMSRLRILKPASRGRRGACGKPTRRERTRSAGRSVILCRDRCGKADN